MKVLFDTSVLVAGLVQVHPSHAAAFPWMRRAHSGEVEGVVAAHGLAELYAALTTLPHRPRITSAAALELIGSAVVPHFRVVALHGREYASLLGKLARAGLVGGIVYDAIAARAAVKAGARRILTLNARDFGRLVPLFDIEAGAP